MYEIFEKLLKEKGVKAADVTRATGVSSTVFSEWKKGKSTPKADKRKKIAEYFGVTLEYLDTGKEPQFDYLYTDENADFLVEVTKMAKNKDFVDRMTKYMSLLTDDKKSIDDMIDFMYEKENKRDDY